MLLYSRKYPDLKVVYGESGLRKLVTSNRDDCIKCNVGFAGLAQQRSN